VRLAYGYDKEITDFVGRSLGCSLPDHTVGIGVINNNDVLVAGVTYYNYRHPKSIEMSIFSNAPWTSKNIIRDLLHYPLVQLNCSRITCIVDIDNKHTLRFLTRLGFVKEGVMRDANPDGDAVIMGLLKTECKWIK
jgi:RimJ/RimL family protein N-acetyltransferase